ncbi:HAD family hydrolase [Streptomyces thermocarboxydovorans]
MADEFMPDEPVRAVELVSPIAPYAPDEGANYSDWPGLTLHRFDSPVPPDWDAVNSLSSAWSPRAGGRTARIGSRDYMYDPLPYVVLTRHLRLKAETTEASAAQSHFICEFKQHFGETLRAQHVLAGTGLAELVDVVLGIDSVPVSEPDPSHLRAVLDQFGVTTDEAIHVGDTNIDATPHNASESLTDTSRGDTPSRTALSSRSSLRR